MQWASDCSASSWQRSVVSYYLQVLVRKNSSAALTAAAAAPSSGMASPAVAAQSPVGGAATACADIDMSKLAQPAFTAKVN